MLKINLIVKDFLLVNKKEVKKMFKFSYCIELIKNVLDNLNEAAVIIDKDFRIEWINKYLEKKGFNFNDIKGYEFYKVFDNLDKIPENDPTLLAFKTKKVQKIIKKGYDKSNYEVTSIPIQENDDVRCVLELSRNISETISTPNILNESNMKFKDIVENMIDGFGIINKDGILTYVNKRLAEMLEYSVEELIGKSAISLFNEENKKKLMIELKKREKGEPSKYELEFTTKTGKQLPTLISATPLFDSNQNHIGSYAVIEDISEIKKLEQKLINDINFSNSIINNLAEGFAAIDSSVKQIIANDRLCEMTGFNRDELLGEKAPFKYWAEENLDKIDSAFKQTLKGVLRDWELIFKRKDGGRFNVLVSPAQIKDSEGNIIFIATVKDITERKKYEKKLNNYKTLFDNINDCAYICDTKGNILLVNRVIEKLTGHKLKELIGKPFAPLFDKKNLEKAIDVYTRTLKGESTQCELTFKKTGTICEYKNEPLYDENKKVIGVIGVLRDITEKKRTEEKIKSLNKVNQEIINGIEEAICLINPDNFNIISANKFFYKEYGLKKEDVVGKKCYFITHHKDAPCGPPLDKCPIKEVLKTGKISKVEHIHFDKDNNRRFVEISVYPIKNTKGKITSIIHIARDITKRKNFEEKLKRVNFELKSKIEELEKFNKLAIGRELKMIELKKRVRELEEKVNTR
jgi:PAS domain S-box-containing protein